MCWCFRALVQLLEWQWGIKPEPENNIKYFDTNSVGWCQCSINERIPSIIAYPNELSWSNSIKTKIGRHAAGYALRQM